MKNLTLLGIDIAKNVFQLHGVDDKGNTVLRKRLTRTKLVEFIVKLQSCIIVIEASSSANHWCRKFKAMGHEVKLISPQFVKPFLKTNKNDWNDSEAICEAASRPRMRYIFPKTIEQEDIQVLLKPFIERNREHMAQKLEEAKQRTLAAEQRRVAAEQEIEKIKAELNHRGMTQTNQPQSLTHDNMSDKIPPSDNESNNMIDYKSFLPSGTHKRKFPESYDAKRFVSPVGTPQKKVSKEC